MPAKANSGRFSLIANQTTPFFLVSGFGSGAYSANLLAVTKVSTAATDRADTLMLQSVSERVSSRYRSPPPNRRSSYTLGYLGTMADRTHIDRRRAIWPVPDGIEGSKVRKGPDSLNATSRSRVLGNIIKQIRVFLSEGPRMVCTGSTTWRDSAMTNFKLFSLAAILSFIG